MSPPTVLDLTRNEVTKAHDPACAEAVFRVLHTPPVPFWLQSSVATHGRSSSQTLQHQGFHIAR